jgi:hypothetical protein
MRNKRRYEIPFLGRVLLTIKMLRLLPVKMSLWERSTMKQKFNPEKFEDHGDLPQC